MEKAIFGAGCFWGVEAAFRKIPGVVSTRVGYSGGSTVNPTYRQVCSDLTGHAEVVEVTFNPEEVSYEFLLETFWKIHDPTTLNRQGPDIGSQYRSVIFFVNEAQEQAARQSLEQEQQRLSRPIVTQIEPAREFYQAEDYHQQYLEKRGLGVCH
ncbi:MAG TPA: peptide-methionine (S)-S-oxide reductase MsrA [Acidobacteriota bacterium]|nr:peptide-methionine (S)-S-oxide reductase MsrA [Acidobacteriota bacterium]